MDKTGAEYLEELKKKEMQSWSPLRKNWVEFIEGLEKINEKLLDSKDPVGDLKSETQKIISIYNLVFWLNSKSILLDDTTTVAFFEKRWGKSLRKIYRMRLSEILTEVKTNKKGLTSGERIKILKSLEAEYKELAGNKNVFRRHPCKEGKRKIALKIQDIDDAIKNIKRQATDAACFNLFFVLLAECLACKSVFLTFSYCWFRVK